MRKDYNPNKNIVFNHFGYNHQVIIPLYIPNSEGYFQDSFKIFKKSLVSLKKTINNKTFITVVNNGSCLKVVSYLNLCFEKGIINEVIHTSNIGKINSIYKGLTGYKFKLITICDADVLFLPNWQNAVYEIFSTFKKTGAVCTTPSSKSYNTNTFNLWLDNFFSNKLKFSKVEDSNSLLKFARSIGDEKFYNKNHLNQYLTLCKGSTQAVVGAGHFVTTYRADILYDFKYKFSDKLLGGGSEGLYLDTIVTKSNLWRLSTVKNFTYHMGNVYETWMDQEVFEKNIIHQELLFISNYKNKNRLNHFIKNKLFKRIIKFPLLYWGFLSYKRLNKSAIKKY